MNHKPILYLPKGSYNPAKYEKIIPTEFAEETRDNMIIIGHESYHKEKALAVIGSSRGSPVFVAGLGDVYTEDLKDILERMREDDAKTERDMIGYKKEKIKSLQESWAEHFDNKVKNHKANPRSFPDPKHIIPKEKRFY